MITTGKILKNARIKKGLNLEQVEKATLIKKKYLKAVEENLWDQFPSRAYAYGVVKNYAEFLGLDLEKIKPYFRREYDRFEKIEFKKKEVKESLSENIQIKIKLTGFILLVIFFLFLSLQLYLYFAPPKIIINEPSQELITTKKDFVIIKGEAETNSQVLINDNEVEIDKNGRFEKKVPIFNGKNTIKIKVIGQNGRVSEKIITVEKTN